MRTGKRRGIGGAIGLLGLSVMIGVPCWLTYREVQRAKASVALIAAIKRHDAPAALTALDAGADPNAKEGEKAASLSQVLSECWDRLRGRMPTQTRTSKKLTALLLATPHYTGNQTFAYWKEPRLVKTLLEKGANPNVSD